MPRCILTPSAETDLREIALYIEQKNPGRGVTYVQEIKDAFKLYAENPLMGRERSEISEGLRSFPFGNYVTLYRPQPDGICVVRVLHGGRDFRRVL